jgi:hypothetical protein
VEVEELVPVQREGVAALDAGRGRVAKASAPSEGFGLTDRDDVGAETRQLGLEKLLLTDGAADDHPVHACLGKSGDLIRGERPARYTNK